MYPVIHEHEHTHTRTHTLPIQTVSFTHTHTHSGPGLGSHTPIQTHCTLSQSSLSHTQARVLTVSQLSKHPFPKPLCGTHTHIPGTLINHRRTEHSAQLPQTLNTQHSSEQWLRHCGHPTPPRALTTSRLSSAPPHHGPLAQAPAPAHLPPPPPRPARSPASALPGVPLPAVKL